MAELARGDVSDRPWGLTLGALGQRGLTGQLEITDGDQRFAIAFANGAVVGARSPAAPDTAARIAMTNHLVTHDQATAIAERVAAAPDRDELAVVIEAAALSAEHADRLRRRIIAQRTARTFSVERGEFVVTDAVPVPSKCALDLCPIIYLGALMNMSDERLVTDLRHLGTHFQLEATARYDLPRFGFTKEELQLTVMLEAGATIAELEAAHRDIDPRMIMAVVYTLVSGLACEIFTRVPPSIAVARAPTGDRTRSPIDPSVSFVVAPRAAAATLAAVTAPDATPAPEPPPPVPEPASRRPRSRTNDLLEFVAIPRAPAPRPAAPRGHTTKAFELFEPRRPATPDPGDDPTSSKR